jgi:small multidrug resistance pump
MFPSWFFLLLAIVSEVLGTTCMKLSAGFSRTLPSILMFLCYGISLVALTVAVRRIEISVAYAIWSGLGTVLIAGIGMLFFNEEIGMLKVASILLVVAGVVGLNLRNV